MSGLVQHWLATNKWEKLVYPLLRMPPDRMDDEQRALYQTILLDPLDMAPRLIYADWLGDHKEGGDQAGTFIRMQIANGETRLFNGMNFRNGFVDEVTFSYETFLTRGYMDVQYQPLTKLTIYNKEPLQFAMPRTPNFTRSLTLSVGDMASTYWGWNLFSGRAATERQHTNDIDSTIIPVNGKIIGMESPNTANELLGKYCINYARHRCGMPILYDLRKVGTHFDR